VLGALVLLAGVALIVLPGIVRRRAPAAALVRPAGGA